jgi:hypothetical protein
MNRLLNTSSITGSAVVPMARARAARRRGAAPGGRARDLGLPARLHDRGGVGSAMMAGPSTISPIRVAERWYKLACRHLPPLYIGTTACGIRPDMRRAAGSTASGASDLPIASTDTASTTARAGIRKE